MKSTSKAKQRAFLAAYVKKGTILGASALAGVDRKGHNKWMKDPEYAREFAEAEQANIDRICAEIHRRGVEGIRKPVIYQGQLQFEPERDANGNVKRDKRGRPVFSTEPLVIREYSDNLLMFWAKSKDPARFRDNYTVDVTANVTAEVRDPELSKLNLEQLRALKAIAEQAAGATNSANGHSGGKVQTWA